MPLSRIKKIARKATSATRLDDLAESLSSSVGTAQDYLAQHTPLDELEAMRRRTGVLAPDVVARNAITAGRALVERDPGRLGDIDLPVVGRVRDVGRAVKERDVGVLADVPALGPGLSGANIRGIYRNIVDPTRELAMTATEDPASIARADFTRLRDPERLLQEQGKAFRARPDDRRKFVTETVLDPANLIGGGAGSLAKQAGRIGLREVALPVAGGLAGGEIGRRVGGETGEQVGRIAGLVGGGLSGNRVERLANAFAGAKLGPDAAMTVTKPNARETIRQMARGPRAMPETVSLHAGPPLKPWMAGSVVGAAGSQATADDDASMQERIVRGFAGAGIGAVGGALAPDLARGVLKAPGAAKRTVMGAVLPSANRDPAITNLIARYSNRARSGADVAAFQVRDRAAKHERFLLDEIAAGRVLPNATGMRAIQDEVAKALTPEDAQAVQDFSLKVPAILQHPDRYSLSGQADAAVTYLRGLDAEQLAKETAAGVAPQSLRENYVPQIWDLERSGPAVRGGLGARQSFQQEHHLDSYLAGIGQGYRPKSDQYADLIAARVKAGDTAIAQRELLDAIKAHPEWQSTKPMEDFVPFEDFKRRFAGFDNAAMNTVLDDLATGAITQAEARRMIREGITPGQQTTYLRQDVADALNAFFAPQTFGTGTFGKGVENVADTGRSLRLGFDLAMVWRLGPMAVMQGAAADVLHPWRGVTAVARAWKDAAPGQFQQRMLTPEYLDWAKRMRGMSPDQLGAVLEMPERGGVVENLLKRNGLDVLNSAERWQFGRLVPALKFHVAETAYRAMQGSRGFRNMPDEVLKDFIAKRIDSTLSGFDPVRAGLNKNQQYVERLSLLSSAWARGMVSNVTDVTKSGPEGVLARRFWGAMIMGSMATSVGLSLAFSNDWSTEHITALLDPRSPDSVTNPNAKNFMGIELPTGDRLNIWGPVTAIARAVLAPIGTGVGAGAESYASARNDQEGFLEAAMHAGIAAFGEGAGSLKNRPYKWIEGRRSVPVGLVQDLVRNADFRGRTIANTGDPGQDFLARAKFGASQLIPSISGTFIDTDRVARPEWDVSDRGRIAGAVAQATGLGFTPGPDDPKVVKDTVSTFLRSHGVEPTMDPVGRYRTAIADGSVGTVAAAEFRAQNEGIDRYIKEKRKVKAAETGRPIGKDAAGQYRTDVDDIDRDREAKLAEIDRKLDEGSMTRDDWKKQRGAIRAKAHAERGQAAATWLGTRNLDEAQQRLDALYDRGDDRKQDRAAMLVEQWYAIAPADESKEGFLAFLDRRRAWKENLKATDPQGYEDWQKTLQSRMSPIEREYQAALEVYDQYNQISPYRNLDVKTARRVSELVNRADNSVRARLYRTRAQAIWADKTADGATKAMARRVASGRYANRERARFRQQNLILSKWFGGDMVSDELERVTA